MGLVSFVDCCYEDVVGVGVLGGGGEVDDLEEG